MAQTAASADYGTGSVAASDTTPNPGDTITVSGTGCPADTAVDFFFDGSPAGSTTSDGSGAFSGQVTVPSDASSGTHTITVQCGSVVMALEITVSPATAGPPVARTGSNSTIPLTQLGLALLAVGGLFVLLARRRRVAQPA